MFFHVRVSLAVWFILMCMRVRTIIMNFELIAQLGPLVSIFLVCPPPPPVSMALFPASRDTWGVEI